MNSIQRFAISVVSIAAFTFVAGCGSSTKEVDYHHLRSRRAGSGRRAARAGTGGSSSNYDHQHLERAVTQFE